MGMVDLESVEMVRLSTEGLILDMHRDEKGEEFVAIKDGQGGCVYVKRDDARTTIGFLMEVFSVGHQDIIGV